MARIEIKSEWCKGCYICVDACPNTVLAVDKEAWLKGFHPVVVAHAEECTLCRNCELLCPDLAITVTKDDDSGHS